MEYLNQLLTELFGLIGFAWTEDEAVENTWIYKQIRETPKASKVAYDLLLTAYFMSVRDAISLLNPDFKRQIQLKGFGIQELFYSEGGKYCDFRLYIEIDRDVR